MVRIPKASESATEDFKMPAEGTYTAIVQAVDPPVYSEMYGNNQQLFKWQLLTMFDDEETEWVSEFEDKDEVVFDYVNVDIFTDGKGDPTRVSKLYKIAKALTPPDEFDPEDAGDTDDFVNRKAVIELQHGVKTMGPNVGKPKLVIGSYKYMKRKNKAKPEEERPEPDDIDDVDSIPF